MRFVATVTMAACLISCAVTPPGEPRAASRPGDPAIDGKDYLLSESDFRAVLALVRTDIAQTRPWLSARRVHVISRTQLEVYARDLRGQFYGDTQGDDWVFRVNHLSTGWKIIRCDPIVITTDLGLTNHWSQPLAAVKSTFDFMKQSSMFATLAAASGGSAPSR